MPELCWAKNMLPQDIDNPRDEVMGTGLALGKDSLIPGSNFLEYPPPSPKYAKTGGKLQEINPKPPQAPPEAGLGVILHIFLVVSLQFLRI